MLYAPHLWCIEIVDTEHAGKRVCANTNTHTQIKQPREACSHIQGAHTLPCKYTQIV